MDLVGWSAVVAPMVMTTLVVGVALLALSMESRRRKRVAAWAAARGWAVLQPDRAFASRWSGEPFRGSGRVSEVVTGQVNGRSAVTFQYSYTTGSGKSRRTHYFHVVALALPVRLGRLELTPDGFGAKIAKAFGASDMDLELEEFNRTWRVAAAPGKFGSDVLHPRMMERLLAPDVRGQCLRIDGGDILWWGQGRPALQMVDARLALLASVVDSIPRFVWQDYGYDPLDDPAARGRRP